MYTLYACAYAYAGGNFLQANKKQLIKKCYNKKENEKGTGEVHGLKG